MHTAITKIAAARSARRRHHAEQTQALWEERRRLARRPVRWEPFRLPRA